MTPPAPKTKWWPAYSVDRRSSKEVRAKNKQLEVCCEGRTNNHAGKLRAHSDTTIVVAGDLRRHLFRARGHVNTWPIRTGHRSGFCRNWRGNARSPNLVRHLV